MGIADCSRNTPKKFSLIEAVVLVDVVPLVVSAHDPVETAVRIVGREPEFLAELLNVRVLADGLREQELPLLEVAGRVPYVVLM